MPTGYTYDVQQGKITELRPFALKVARGMGALIMMRDDPMDAPIPEAFEPDTAFDDRCLADDLARLESLAGMSGEECQRAAEKDYAAACDAWKTRKDECDLQRSRYEAMLQKVMAWMVPEQLSGLKAYMTEQLKQSIEFDCSYHDPAPIMLSGDQWRYARTASATNAIAYHEESRAEEIKRTDERNAWLAALRTSLPTKEEA